MKEFQQIVSALETHDVAILATVVDIEGSGYRRPGARMLISPDGFGIGTVSGGCLEADVLERAKTVLATGAPAVITYDTMKDEGSVFGLGMGCRGIVRILLEPVTKDAPIVARFRDAVAERKTCFMSTVIAGGEVGARAFDGALVEEFAESGLAIGLRTNDGAEYFLEKIAPPLKVLIFGAGHDAVPLVNFMSELGWQTVVVDHRAAFATRERFAAATEVVNTDPREFASAPIRGDNLAAVAMTHNFERDRALIPSLLKGEFVYIGALGPKTRTGKILAECGETFTTKQLASLFAPVGLDIGGDTPEAIALSIVAEIQAVVKSRAGGHLRHRDGPIYNRK